MTDIKSKDEIRYISLGPKEIPPIRLEIVNFLLNLGPERETLFDDVEIDEEMYPERCEKLADKINRAIIAYFENKIVGIFAGVTKRKGLLRKLSPFVWEFMVVNSDFQGKGIGSKLYENNIKYHKGKWKIRTGKVKIQNKTMQYMNKKYGLVVFGRDDAYVHNFHIIRDEMKIFSPIVSIILRLIIIEYPKLAKYFQLKPKRV